MFKLRKKEVGLILQQALIIASIISLTVVLAASSLGQQDLDHVIKVKELSLIQVILIKSYSYLFFMPFVFIFFLVFLAFMRGRLSFENLVGSRRLVFISRGVVIFLFFVGIINAAGFIYETSASQNQEMRFRQISSHAGKDINIILIVIDALRADHLGSYGYARKTSPVIDNFVRESTLFKNCYSQAPFTTPSVGSLLTSLYPRMHGATQRASALSQKVKTLAELLQQKGFLTYGYVTNPNLKTMFHFDQGFDFYDDNLIQDKFYYVALRRLPLFNKVISAATERRFDSTDKDNIDMAMPRIMKWLHRYKQENFFMYLHFMEPHEPYNPPWRYKQIFSYNRKDKVARDMAFYDGEIRFCDEYLGLLLEQLKTYGIYDKTLIIITSDHGEAFGEHNDYGHGHTIYQELVHVPLIVKHDEAFAPGKVVSEPVRLIDVMPTILGVAHVSYDGLEGCSLLGDNGDAMIKGSGEDVFLERIFDIEMRKEKHVLMGVVRDNHWKYLYAKNLENDSLVHQELYDLKSDPKELNNLVAQRAHIVGDLKRVLDRHDSYCSRLSLDEDSSGIDFGTMEQLRSLGYL